MVMGAPCASRCGFAGAVRARTRRVRARPEGAARMENVRGRTEGCGAAPGRCGTRMEEVPARTGGVRTRTGKGGPVRQSAQ